MLRKKISNLKTYAAQGNFSTEFRQCLLKLQSILNSVGGMTSVEIDSVSLVVFNNETYFNILLPFYL